MMQAVGEGHSAITQDLFPLKTTLTCNVIHQSRSCLKSKEISWLLMKKLLIKVLDKKSYFH